MLVKIKTLIGIKTEEQDSILEIMIEDARTAVLLYCNRKTLPEQLEQVVRELIIQRFKEENAENVASIKRGDTQINYNAIIERDSFTEKQKQCMNCFRRTMIK